MNPRAFGFAEFAVEDHVTFPERTARSLDLPTSAFIPPALLEGLMTDDRALVAYNTEPDGRATATAVSLIERLRTEIFGTVVEVAGELFLRGDPHVTHALVPVIPSQDLRAGVAARCLLGTALDEPCTPLEAFEDALSVPAIHARMLARYGISPDVPGLPAHHQARPGSPGRRDLRDLITITIDSDTSKDLDDALSVLPAGRDGGLRVFVHIADVAAAVQAGTALDDAARSVATSVYLPGANRPMLPRALSEDLLSLLPGVDRDALTVELRIDVEGNITSVDLFETTVRSNARLSYETAAAVLAGVSAPELDPGVEEALAWLRTASARLSLQRTRRGGVDSRRVEPEREVTCLDGELTTCAAVAQNDANLLIERLMVATNESVAGWLAARGLPALFRVHDEPGVAAARDLETFASNLGLHPGFGDRLTPLAMAAFDVQVASCANPRVGALWNVMLGHLGRARYTPEPSGHFGLGSPLYLHFTSPIRRYADLVVHRIVKAYLAGDRDGNSVPDDAELHVVAARCNDGARRASRAESDARKAMWMQALLAEDDAFTKVRQGRVSSVTERGMFIVLDGSLISGFMGFRSMADGPWHAETHRAVGRSTVYELGQEVAVRIESMDPVTGQMELVLPQSQPRPQRRRPARRGGSAPRAARV